MIFSRRRLFSLSLATAATAVSGTEALAKTAHHAKHSVTKHASAHSVHGHGHIHLAKAHCAPHHGKHGHVLEARHVTRRGIAKPYLAKNLATGEAGCSIRKVSLRNLHTEECLDTVYYENGHYDPDALHAVNRVLRDFRNGQQHQIEPQLIDLLDTIRAKTGTNQPFHVISGYRSPQTNAMLHEESSGVAAHSLHMEGEAIDIRLADVALDHLRNAAWSLQRGGVGYYAASNFVHVDVGDVRHWGFSA
jgi:uncharacterized protein YcbK (DUF882 family)